MARIVVIGAGVTGLTTAYEFLQKSKRNTVTVVAAQIPTDFQFKTNYTSPFAGANWSSFASKDNVKQQEIDTPGYYKFMKLAATRPESGVIMRTHYHYYSKEKVEHDGTPEEYPWFERLPGANFERLKDFDHDKFAYGYKFDSVVISTTYYLSFLMNECYRTGRFDIQRANLSNLKEGFQHHHSGIRADLVVNCSGLRARELVPDTGMYGVRGVTILVENDIGLTSMIGANTYDPDHEDEMLYIMPRKEGGLVIGGTFGVGLEWAKTSSDEQTDRILNRARTTFPELGWKDFKIIRKQVGFRPYRKGGLRIELDRDIPGVIHSYGHGGEGYQASWGSAAKVLKLADEYFGKTPAKL